MWYDDDKDKFFRWYKSYQKRKAQKANIKEELMPITWHPSRYWNWCMSEDEKKRDRKIMGINMKFFVSDEKKKEQQIKMSFVLNVSNDSSKPEEFSLKDIEVLVDNKEQN